jgi:hypothetical protein
VDFYQEVGFLSIAPKFENEEFLDQQDYQKVDKMEHLSWPQNYEAIFQPQNAGHISPRLFSVGICKYKPGYKLHDLL